MFKRRYKFVKSYDRNAVRFNAAGLLCDLLKDLFAFKEHTL